MVKFNYLTSLIEFTGLACVKNASTNFYKAGKFGLLLYKCITNKLHLFKTLNSPICFGYRQSDPLCCNHKVTLYWIYHSISLELILVFEGDWMLKIS